MASTGDDLVAIFRMFCVLAGSTNNTMMSLDASQLLVKTCFEKDYKKYDVMSISDNTFKLVKEEGEENMVVNKGNVDKYISVTGHEIAKKKTKNSEIAANDTEVLTIKTNLTSCVSGCSPNNQTDTGNVESLTDTRQYIDEYKGKENINND